VSFARKLMMTSLLGATPPGQQEWTTPGTYSFIVPAGVYTLCGVSVGGGGGGPNAEPWFGGCGGGLHWRNGIPVTPGEELSVVVGGGGVAGIGPIGGESALKRGATYLLRATGGSPFGQGRGGFDLYGGGGGDGGTVVGTAGNGGLGAGAAGYMGNGGQGGNFYDTISGSMPDIDSGGGRGGDVDGIPTGWSGVDGQGEGVGLKGRTPTFSPGSLGSPKCGAGGRADQNGQNGGLRLMWGGGRSYPDNAGDT